MKKTVKKISCAALCAVILFCMAVPAFAVTGYEVKDKNLTYIGVRARCTSDLTTEYAEGKLNLSYLPAYSSNYLPESDYYCRVKLYLDYTNFTVTTNDTLGASGMYFSLRMNHNDNICAHATFYYFVNGPEVYEKTF